MGPLGKLYHSSVEGLAAAFSKAVEATAGAADTFVAKPVAAGGRGVAQGVKWTWRRVFRRK
jgi:hypothetical protein